MLWFISMTSISLHLNVEYNMIPLDSVKKKKVSFHMSEEWIVYYKTPAAFKSANSLTTCSGMGGEVGRWSPVAWNPFSSAVPTSSAVSSTCLWDPLSSTLAPSSLSNLFHPTITMIHQYCVSYCDIQSGQWKPFYCYERSIHIFLNMASSYVEICEWRMIEWCLTKSCSFRPRSFRW